MRILVGTLLTIENEIDRCVASVRSQTLAAVDHVIVRDLPNKAAHDRLYRTFMERAAEADLFVKVDADMVLCDERFFERLAAWFDARPVKDGLIIRVHDFFTDTLIEGLHAYRSHVRWVANDERVFVDRADVPIERIDYDTRDLEPAAWHCPDPSAFQAFHFGMHKGVKVREALRRHLASTASTHAENIDATRRHFVRTGDRRLGLACIGAELALRGELTAEHVDFDHLRTREVFSRFEPLGDDGVRRAARRLHRRNWGAVVSGAARASLVADGLLRVAARRIVPSAWHSSISRMVRHRTPAVSTAKHRPMVTWLLPVRNAMPYLGETLQSIEAQTYRNHRVLVWDNGSNDGTIEELRRWIPTRLDGEVVTDRPMGLGACLAAMIEHADTELCARVDGDDVNEPNRLERQVRYMLAHPRVGAVGSDVTVIDEGGRAIGKSCVETDDAAIRWRLRFCNALNHPSVMLRRSCVLEAGNYRDEMPGQDYDLWLRMSLIGPLGNITEPLLRYRRHGGSVTAAGDSDDIERQRCLVERYAGCLFPDIERNEAMRLRDLLTDEAWDDVTIDDALLLRDIAIHAARGCGLNGRAFLQTPQYRRQARSLWLSWLKRYRFVRAVRWGWRRVRGMERPGHFEEPMVKPWPTDRGGKRAA